MARTKGHFDDMWDVFGFAQSPYRVTPLAANDRDMELFTSRSRGESAEFLSMMSDDERSVVILSGDIGIGKTSFFNIQQYLLVSGKAGWCPKLIPCSRLTSLMAKDEPNSLARRIVYDAVQNIQAYCDSTKQTVQPECQAVSDWMSHRPKPAGWQISAGVLGAGRQVQLPPVGDTTLETWRTILEALAYEARRSLGVKGFIVCLDNAETLSQSELAQLAMSYRDTLFTIEGIWWVLIGQSGLYRQIDQIDRRVSQRISGSGVELSHFTLEEFHKMIEQRVQVYKHRDDAKSPLSKHIHDLLFQASCGEIRFVFDTANTLVKKTEARVRLQASGNLPENMASPEVLQRLLTETLQKELIDRQIPDQWAIPVLGSMSEQAITDLHEAASTRDILEKFGDDTIRKDAFERFGFVSAEEFVTGFLEPLRSRGFLGRVGAAEGEYRLKSFAWLARQLRSGG